MSEQQPTPPTISSTRFTEKRSQLIFYLVIAGLTIAGAVLRAVRLDHPMRYDESFTFLVYVAPDDWKSWFDYSTPNNHVLHTLLVRVAYFVGGMQPEVLRFPAFVAAVMLIPAAAALAHTISGSRLAAVVASLLVATSSVLIEYAVNARGYSLLCLFSVLLFIVTARILTRPDNFRGWLAWVALSSLGALTIPVMLYPVILAAGAFVIGIVWLPSGNKKRAFALFAISLTATALLTICLYAPVLWLNGPGAIIANRFVAPLALQAVVSGAPAMAEETLSIWTRDTSILWMGLMAAGIASAAFSGVRNRNVFALLPVWSVLVLSLVIFAQRVLPFPRVWLFLLPVYMVIAACGLCWMIRSAFPAAVRSAAILAIPMALVCADAAWHSTRREFLASEERILSSARDVVAELAMAGLYSGDSTLLWDYSSPNWPPFQYYHLLNCPEGYAILSHQDPRCRRAYIAIPEGQSIEAVYGSRAGLAQRYAAPVEWRKFRDVTVYVSTRRARL